MLKYHNPFQRMCQSLLVLKNVKRECNISASNSLLTKFYSNLYSLQDLILRVSKISCLIFFVASTLEDLFSRLCLFILMIQCSSNSCSSKQLFVDDLKSETNGSIHLQVLSVDCRICSLAVDTTQWYQVTKAMFSRARGESRWLPGDAFRRGTP